MDNDTLIDQARALYASLKKKQCEAEVCEKPRAFRFDRMIRAAYGRYIRRLNHCALCYRYRSNDCARDEPKNCNQELWKMHDDGKQDASP